MNVAKWTFTALVNWPQTLSASLPFGFGVFRKREHSGALWKVRRLIQLQRG
jgi:hypothetical protein